MNSVYFELCSEQNEILEKDVGVYFKICPEVLKKHGPRNKKYIRGNKMTKELSEAFMQRSRKGKKGKNISQTSRKFLCFVITEEKKTIF